MKKTIVALAVATLAAPIVAQADTTLYGRVHARVNAFDAKDADVANAGHRIGIKSSFDLGGGLSSFAKIETQLGNDKGAYKATGSTDAAGIIVRHAHAGLKGGFGSVAIGRQGNPYAENVYKSDRHETFSGTYESVTWRNGSSIRYDSPDLGGFNLKAAVVLDGEGNEDQNAVDAMTINANFSIAGFAVSVGHYSVDYNDDGNAETAEPAKKAVTGLGASYSFGPGSVAMFYESNGEGDEEENLDLSVMFDVNEDLTLGLDYAQQDKANSDSTPSRILVGAYYNVGKATNVYAEVASNDPDSDADSTTDLSLGFRVKF